MGTSHLRPIQLGVGLLLSLALMAGCRTGVPVVDRGEKPPTQDGTIAGHVRTEGSAALVGRVVRAVGVDSNQKFEVSTNVAGTYTLKVPPGRYRLEVGMYLPSTGTRLPVTSGGSGDRLLFGQVEVVP